MKTWSRVDLKNWAKETLHRNYWRMVLVGFIMMLITGATNGGSSSGFRHLQSIDIDDNEISIEGDDDAERALRNLIWGIKSSMEDANPAMLGGIAAGILVVVFVILSISMVFSFFLVQPLIVGGKRFFSRSLVEDAQLNEIVCAFGPNYMNIVKNMFLMNLFIGLWSLLFVIPGIIKQYEYRMIPYLLGEHPDMSTQELFDTSKEMMYGHKWAAFVLDLSFIGWGFLGIITCGIAMVFWVNPYIWLTGAALYRRLGGLDAAPYGPSDGYGPIGGYSQGNSYGQNGEYSQETGYGQGSGYNQESGYGQGSGYSQGNGYGQDTGYNQSGYGQNGGNSQGSGYGQNGEYSQGNGYGQDNGYNQGNGYGQDNGYNQGNGYGQGNGYNQGNGYGQGNGYNQGSGYGQNTPYGQDYYNTNDGQNHDSDL